MGFGAIKDDFLGALSNIASLFGGGGSHPYPAAQAALVTNTEVDEGDRSWRKSLGYSFEVVRVDKGGNVLPADGWQEFVLQINPQELTQDEIFAIEVTPTFSGVLVEHQGVTLKDISIRGTTGLSPNRREGGALPQNGRPAFAAGRSGYYEFHELRSYIRTYVEQKRNDQGRAKGELRLIWRNLRDHENLFVEPQKFTMTRSSSRPHLYEYNVALKAIGIAKSKQAGGFFEGLDNVIESVQDGLDAGLKIMQGGIGFLERVDRDVTNTILNPVRTIAAFVRDYKAAGKRLDRMANKLSRLRVKDVYKSIADIYDNANDLIGKHNDEYDAAKGRVRTLSTQTSAAATYEQLQVLNGLKQVKQALDKMLQTNKMFAQNETKATNKKIKDLYAAGKKNRQKSAAAALTIQMEKDRAQAEREGNTVKAAALAVQIQQQQRLEAQAAGSLAQKLTLVDAGTLKLSTIKGDDTIQTIAARELGNADTFKDLIVLNDLKPPYVDSTPLEDDPVRLPGVLRPGDKIFVPQSGSPAKSGNTARNVDYPISAQLSEVEKNFGIDLKLTDDFDLEISATQDAKLIASSENVAQALLLKLFFELGSLKRHPEIGTALSIGVKAVGVAEIAAQVRRSLTTDNRVESVIFAEVIQEGNSTVLNLVLKLSGTDQPITVPVPFDKAG